MPVEVAILAPAAANVLAQRELAEAMSPPLVVRESSNAGSITISELDNTPVLTLLRAKRVDDSSELRRVLGPGAHVPSETRFWTEGYLPYGDVRRGLILAHALAALIEGVTIVKGMD
ncbi:hypothetical protein ITJ38_10510 [Agreia pratensis]|uniref:hypothetical protein n=1 Tax=Agreia pratensis TaxID=150121 RepID=UPI00188D19FB|nr:hypothetical protein [Agreia pratensis]MBF4634833.1 hypothetical protein [Agreia pratensis]